MLEGLGEGMKRGRRSLQFTGELRTYTSTGDGKKSGGAGNVTEGCILR